MLHQQPLRFRPPNGDDDIEGSSGGAGAGQVQPGNDLPYRVEVWDKAEEFPERLVAVTANASLGYAAFYAAARENPGRLITLRCEGRVVSRWTLRAH